MSIFYLEFTFFCLILICALAPQMTKAIEESDARASEGSVESNLPEVVVEEALLEQKVKLRVGDGFGKEVYRIWRRAFLAGCD